MLACFAPANASARSVRVIAAPAYAAWLETAAAPVRAWLAESGFKPKGGAVALLPGGGAVLLTSDPVEPWDAAALQAALPAGDWRLDDPDRLLPANHDRLFTTPGPRFADALEGSGVTPVVLAPGERAVLEPPR